MAKALDFDVGFRRQNKAGSWYTVVEKIGSHSTVVFDSGFTTTRLNREVFIGQIKDKLFPSLFGVGYLGLGEIPASVIDSNGKTVQSREYSYWVRMLSRVYKSGQKAYEDVTVCNEWHSFQTFANWCRSKVGFLNEDFVLDKDVLVSGNKVYAPDKCCFLPRNINALFVCRGREKGHYFRAGKYEVSWSKKQIGRTTCKDEADRIHNQHFEKVLKEMAEDYREKLDSEVYHHLLTIKEK